MDERRAVLIGVIDPVTSVLYQEPLQLSYSCSSPTTNTFFEDEYASFWYLFSCF